LNVEARFDLRKEQWIPVRGVQVNALGFHDLFNQAHRVEGLALAIPPAAAALWRVLYAITYRVTGLDDPGLSVEEWLDRRAELLAKEEGFDAERVADYFASDRFDLFDPQRPWLQDPRLAEQCAKPSGVNKLVIDRPSGSNQVWFGHFQDGQPVPLEPAEAAWHVLAQLYYGAAGRCATRTVGSVSEANSTAGPLRGSVSYHPLGKTVFESLLCGLTPPAEASVSPAARLAPWDLPDLSDPLGQPTLPSWPVAQLVGRARHAVLLVPSADGSRVDNAYLTWAWRQPALPAADPYLMLRTSREGTPYVPFADHKRALWRDLDALLMQTPPEGGGPKRPPVFDALTGGVPDQVWSRLRVRAYGFEQDRQTRDKQWFTATTPPVLRYLREREATARARIGTLRATAESAADLLNSALKQAWQVSSTSSGKPGKRDTKPGPWTGRALSFYWPRAEQIFWDHVDNPAGPPARELFGRAAFEAVDYAVGDQEQQVRVARAVATVRRRLGGFQKGGAA
jgi:CRISPR system Cascade subunit CasA